MAKGTLSDHQQRFDSRRIRSTDQSRMAQVALLLRGFFGQDVVLVSVFALDLAGSRHLESLLGGGIGFHFRHLSVTVKLA